MIDLYPQRAFQLYSRPAPLPAGMTQAMVDAGTRAATSICASDAVSLERLVQAVWVAMQDAKESRPGVRVTPGENEMWAG